MKKTDIIMRFDPSNSVSKGLQIVILDTEKYGTQLIELDGPKLIAVPLTEHEWAKLRIDKRETVKLNLSEGTPDLAPRSIFDYVCYTITTEKKGSDLEPGCEYFIGNSSTFTPVPYSKQKARRTKTYSSSKKE